MSGFTKSRALLTGLFLVVPAAGVTGCSRQSPNLRSQELRTAAAAGANMQKNGIMSQSDYVRIRELEHSVTQTHTISDADLTWTLNLLRTSGNPIPRARAMTALFEIRPMSPAQKAAILPAITPYLSSADKLDRLGAQRVQKAAQASGA